MSKLITGFLLGVFVAFAVVYWLDEESPTSKPGLLSQPPPHMEHSGTQEESSENRIVEAVDNGTLTQNAPTTVESVLNESQSTTPAASFTGSQQPTDSTSTSPESTTAVINDQYPPEIAEMIRNRVDKGLQARYESDEREESWATYMEGQLAGYFAQKPLLAQFSFSLVDCRTSVCSIHALGYGPDALTQWNAGTADLVSQQWFDFNDMSMSQRNPEPDILA
ncbi:MAG: hypothetical protein RLN85_14335, partial [Pseudomonadales bacterium]